MRLRRLQLLFLSETKCNENVYFSEEFCVFLSGGTGRNETHGVGMIVHRDLLQSVFAFRAISSEIILLQLKITGDHLTFFGIYCPHDDHDIDVRQNVFDELQTLHAEYNRGGPVGYCGDFSSKIRTRTL